MTAQTLIAMLDEDHVMRLGRYALAGSAEAPDGWVRDFFLPDRVDPASIYALADGLHEADGVGLAVPAHGPSPAPSEASIVIFRRGVIDEAFLEAHPKLRLVQKLGEQSDTIDLTAARTRGIPVSCVPRLSLQHTAEHTVLLMLALAKQLVNADRAVRTGSFDETTAHPHNNVCFNWSGISPLGGLFGTTVGIIGLGEVGLLVARLAKAFGCRVLYSNRRRLAASKEASAGVEYAPTLGDLLEQADFVTLHATNTPENERMMDAAAFARMKRTACFINTSRGSLVDEDALFIALSKGLIAGAGLDVHAQEPRPPDRFGGVPNLIMTPHIAGTRTAVIDEFATIFDNCRAVLRGGAIKHRLV